jgi:hypothetical protein
MLPLIRPTDPILLVPAIVKPSGRSSQAPPQGCALRIEH